MRIALHSTLAVSKKEPLAEMLGRIRQAFLDGALGEPTVRFMLLDSPRKGSAIDRAVKRYPRMERFVTLSPLMPGQGEARYLSNSVSGEPAEFATLQAIAAGVPRSFPFGSVTLHFHAPIFGEALPGLPRVGHSHPGVMVIDNRWMAGRSRSLSAYIVVDVEEAVKKLPPNPAPVEAVIKACGKVRSTQQVGLLAALGGTPVLRENAEAVKAIISSYRARIHEIAEIADLPHDLPPAAEIRHENPGVTAGPRKPALDAAFNPMGYTCRGGSGQFHLTRRTAANHTAELYLDVGTWSHSVTAIFFVQGVGFKASLVLPVTPRDLSRAQYPIGDAAQWQKIVENLAAMVRELDRSFVAEIDQAAGPAPAWYQPGS